MYHSILLTSKLNIEASTSLYTLVNQYSIQAGMIKPGLIACESCIQTSQMSNSHCWQCHGQWSSGLLWMDLHWSHFQPPLNLLYTKWESAFIRRWWWCRVVRPSKQLSQTSNWQSWQWCGYLRVGTMHQSVISRNQCFRFRGIITY